MSRTLTVSELHDELVRRIAAGQGKAPVTVWVQVGSWPDQADVRCGVRQVVPADESFPEVQLWGNT